MTLTLEQLLGEMIDNIIKEELDGAQSVSLQELSPFSAVVAKHKNLLDPNSTGGSLGSHDFQTSGDPDVQKLLKALVARRGGKATLKKDDMEKLDMLTRWMKWIPGGTKYRRKLAKYLRTPVKKSQDTFSDFRRYSYDND